MQVLYTFAQDGSVQTSWQVDTRRFMPKRLQGELNSLPRVGVELPLPSAMQQCVWFGRCAHARVWKLSCAAVARDASMACDLCAMRRWLCYKRSTLHPALSSAYAGHGLLI